MPLGGTQDNDGFSSNSLDDATNTSFVSASTQHLKTWPNNSPVGSQLSAVPYRSALLLVVDLDVVIQSGAKLTLTKGRRQLPLVKANGEEPVC